MVSRNRVWMLERSIETRGQGFALTEVHVNGFVPPECNNIEEKSIRNSHVVLDESTCLITHYPLAQSINLLPTHSPTSTPPSPSPPPSSPPDSGPFHRQVR